MRGEPKLSQFGPALTWLLSKEVSSSRLASLFQTTPENIRVIAFRNRQRTSELTAEVSMLGDPPGRELAAALGVRPVPDEVVPTPAGNRKLDRLTSEIDSIADRHTGQYAYFDAVRALRRIVPLVGYPADARRIALLARLRQHVAWFLVHSGQCSSAALEARAARDLWRIAYHESPRREYADRFIQCALIGSHALLLTCRPQDAWQTLDVARGAAESIGAPIGSDHFRQRGVALFQLREDERAAVQFRQSAEAMERMGEARIPAQIVLTGSRHIHLLGRVNWEGALGVFKTAGDAFGKESLEASMALHWAAACGLSTDSASVMQRAYDLITAQPMPVAQFGHQLTIRRLLAVTPELGLDDRLRRAWMRRALYENAFRTR